MAGDGRAGLLVGETIAGRYRLIKRLGVEPFGTAYLAEATGDGRTFVLRILPGFFAEDDPFARRFLQQVPAAKERSRIHPTFVAIQEAGHTADGRLFLALTDPGGRRLDDVLREDGPLDVSQGLRLGIQIGEGLEAAHNHGYPELPAAPQQIAVSGGETVKLLGSELMGLKRLGVLDRFDPATAASEPIAPEQRDGRPITDRTTVYVYGVVLHQLLSGLVAAGDAAEAPKPLRKLRPEIPRAVERVVMQALDPNPRRRPASITTVLNDLSAELLRLSEPQGASRGRVAAIAALAILLLAGGTWFLLSRGSRGDGGTEARQPLPSSPSEPAKQATPAPSASLTAPRTEGDVLPVVSSPASVTREPSVAPASQAAAPPSAPPGPAPASRRLPPIPREQTLPPLPRREETPPGVSQTPPAPPPQATRQEPPSPDPAAIIDWLLKDAPVSN